MSELRPVSGLFRFAPVAALFLRFAEAGGDPSVFCYRMGVDFLSSGRLRFLAPDTLRGQLLVPDQATSSPKRNQVACSNLFSTFSARFSTQKD